MNVSKNKILRRIIPRFLLETRTIFDFCRKVFYRQEFEFIGKRYFIGKAGSRNTGGIGGMVRGLIDEVRADSARREAAMHETMYEVADALRPFRTASPEAIVQRGLDSSTGEQAAGDAVLRRQRGSHEFTREFLSNSGFSR